MGECNEGSCESQEGGCCEMSAMLMKLADEAWGELMKEKMKKAIEKERGEKMNKVAAVSVQASLAYWEHKMQGKAQCHEFSENLKKAFMG